MTNHVTDDLCVYMMSYVHDQKQRERGQPGIKGWVVNRSFTHLDGIFVQVPDVHHILSYRLDSAIHAYKYITLGFVKPLHQHIFVALSPYLSHFVVLVLPWP